MCPILRETEITNNGDEITEVKPVDTELAQDMISYVVSEKYGASADGKYSLESNVFKPTESGIYVITAEYSYTDADEI